MLHHIFAIKLLKTGFVANDKWRKVPVTPNMIISLLKIVI